MNYAKTVVIVGGGIAGLSCLEALVQDYDPKNPQFDTITLISGSRLVKKIINYQSVGRNLEQFDVTEGDINDVGQHINLPKNLKFCPIIGFVEKINTSEKTLIYHDINENSHISRISFDILCLCHGSKPKLLEFKGVPEFRRLIEDRIIVLRDTSTVEEFKDKLSACRRLVVVGNGGISLELISKVKNCEKIWIVRDDYVGSTFFDSGASKFLLSHLTQATSQPPPSGPIKYNFHPDTSASSNLNKSNHIAKEAFGPALGPDWLRGSELTGVQPAQSVVGLDVIYEDEVDDIIFNEGQRFPLSILTKKGKSVHCDLVVSAIGVRPNLLSYIGKEELQVSAVDGGILVDEQMRTELDGVYAAGDVISCDKWPQKDCWFQMRLWTQARQMGFYAGRCIVAHLSARDPSIYSNFDVFTHCTSFFGFKLILLGKYNAQFLSDEDARHCEALVRVRPGKDYVKLLVKNGKLFGAVLVGDTSLEETVENLIHDCIDVSHCKDQLLDGTVDIEDYFD